MSVWPRIAASVRYRLSARSLYLDLHTHADDTIVLVGSRRSGTTWLSDLAVAGLTIISDTEMTCGFASGKGNR